MVLALSYCWWGCVCVCGGVFGGSVDVCGYLGVCWVSVCLCVCYSIILVKIGRGGSLFICYLGLYQIAYLFYFY